MAVARGTRTDVVAGAVAATPLPSPGVVGVVLSGQSDQSTSPTSAATDTDVMIAVLTVFQRRFALASFVIATGPEIASGLSRVRIRSVALFGRSAGSFSRHCITISLSATGTS